MPQSGQTDEGIKKSVVLEGVPSKSLPFRVKCVLTSRVGTRSVSQLANNPSSARRNEGNSHPSPGATLIFSVFLHCEMIMMVRMRRSDQQRQGRAEYIFELHPFPLLYAQFNLAKLSLSVRTRSKNHPYINPSVVDLRLGSVRAYAALRRQ